MVRLTVVIALAIKKSKNVLHKVGKNNSFSNIFNPLAVRRELVHHSWEKCLTSLVVYFQGPWCIARSLWTCGAWLFYWHLWAAKCSKCAASDAMGSRFSTSTCRALVLPLASFGSVCWMLSGTLSLSRAFVFHAWWLATWPLPLTSLVHRVRVHCIFVFVVDTMVLMQNSWFYSQSSVPCFHSAGGGKRIVLLQLPCDFYFNTCVSPCCIMLFF